MFTGIIEEVGTLAAVKRAAKSESLVIRAPYVLQDAKIGDSIAVNGICLTVTNVQGDTFMADVMAETMRRTSLGVLAPGSAVNLERAMAANGRFGGHIVSGHIDGTGTITDYRREENAVWVTIRTTPAIMRYIVEKGSIAIDGISLTVASVFKESFSVSVIPHTGQATTLLTKKPQDPVNLENDIIGKYVDHLMHAGARTQTQSGENLTMEFLAQHGYL